MRADSGYKVKSVSDHLHKELMPEEVYAVFAENYLNISTPLELLDYHFVRNHDVFKVVLTVKYNGWEQDVTATGNGRLDAVSNAVKKLTGMQYTLTTYQEHALDKGSTARAVSYVGIEVQDGKTVWGAGVHEDIIAASIMGLISAVNHAEVSK